MEFKSTVRPSPIAGTWYTSDPQRLASQVDGYISQAKLKEVDLQGRVLGLVAPHAGHRYSGRTAGYAYKAVQESPRDLVVILSPYHPYSPASLLTTAHSAYRTPLGDVPVAIPELEQLGSLLEKQGNQLNQIASDEEHSLEIQLPFLQRAWQMPFRLLPLMVRTLEPNTIRVLADAVYAVIRDESFLIIASTDLSHFYPLDIAESLDAEMLRRIKSFSPEKVLSAEAEGSASACGSGAVAAMLWITRLAGADRVSILNYSTSADATGDSGSVVGYGAATVTAPD